MLARLRESGMPTVDMTSNDLAKDHLRHLVSGPICLPEVAASFLRREGWQGGRHHGFFVYLPRVIVP